MTIYIDPYHTSSGMVLDMTKVITSLKESTVRDPLDGTNLGVASINSITPVFITGCRDSERDIPSFAHPILIKNFNGKSYLFTDMTLFVKASANLLNIDSNIRSREEFEFTKARAIASLVWAGGGQSRFANGMGFVSSVFAALIAQTLSKYFALIFTDSMKIQMIALGFYESLYVDGPVNYAKDMDMSMMVARKASDTFKIPFTQALSFYKQLDTPMADLSDMCEVIVKQLDNVGLNPIQGRPGSGFNSRVLLNLIGNVWFSTNSKLILPVAMEHPPTLAAIVYYCMNYNNFKKQQLGQTIQSIGRSGKAATFNDAFAGMLEEFTQATQSIRPVMEYMDPATYIDSEEHDLTEVQKLLADLESNPDEISKVSNEDNNIPSIQIDRPLNADDVVDGRPIV